MDSINATQARKTLYKLMNEVNENRTPIQITSKHGDCILLSAEDWKAIVETQHLNAIPGMVESISKGSKTAIKDCIPLEKVDW